MNRIMPRILICLCTLCLCAQTPPDTRTLRPQQESVQPARQESRVALVIGNSNYTGAFLKNPVNDARGMQAALESCKFEVTLLTDATKRQMEEAIRAFGDRLRGGAVGLFYYAGHGVQMKGENYLIPIGAKLDQEVDLTYQGVNVGEVLDRMDAAKNALNIVILDACRNNPFARSWHRGMGDRGLASVNAPTGTLIAYATAPGQEAADGNGGNGLYTGALLQEMKEPGLSLLELFQRVRQKVKVGSEGAQVPWESNSTVGDFYFRPLVVNPIGPTEAQLEATYWQGIQDSRTMHDFESFLTRFPHGNFAELAKVKLANLQRAAANIVVSNLAEPWKALRRSKLETKGEYGVRVAGLGALKVGTAIISLANYDVDKQQLVVPLQPDVWAKPYVQVDPVVLKLDRTQMRQLLGAGGHANVAAHFNVREGHLKASQLTISTAIGNFRPDPGPPPVVGAIYSAFGTWETTVQVDTVALQLVQVPKGSFTMGTRSVGPDVMKNARPAHPVTISQDIWFGKFPVTQEQWLAVMGNNPSQFTEAGLQAPVEMVSWEDAQQFIAELNLKQSEWVFRLPTEAEWEYACRAGTKGETYGPVGDIAWYDGNSQYQTHAVGQKRPNDFDLYDMNGNVWQWCQDWLGDYSSQPVTDPVGPPDGLYRVRRGGAWVDASTRIRSASRDGDSPDTHSSFLGFRVVAVPNSP